MIDIKVPAVGESISEVTLLKWNKKDGEYVERDEVIAELESEKATFEVNAEQSGVIKLGDLKEGDTIKIGDLLASIDESASKPSGNGKPPVEKAPVTPVKEKGQQPIPESIDVKASPVATAMLADKKMDPKTVKPTGPQGKILKDDVLLLFQAREKLLSREWKNSAAIPVRKK